jgi:hypothetical protein
VPFASTAHGMLLRAVKAQGWDPQKDVNIITQAPEVAGSALQANKIEAHADFVPFAELFPHRGFARKIFDGAQANAPTYHGSLVDGEYAKKYPEIVVAFLRAAIEADRLIAAEPEKYSELIEKVTGIEAAVNYLFHGPLGLQTRDLTWKPEYRKALATSIETLRLMKPRVDLKADTFIDDQYIRAAFKQSGLNYEAKLKNYDKLPLKAKDAVTGKPITDFQRLAGIWVAGRAEGAPLRQHRRRLRRPAEARVARQENACRVCARPDPPHQAAGAQHLVRAMPRTAQRVSCKRTPPTPTPPRTTAARCSTSPRRQGVSALATQTHAAMSAITPSPPPPSPAGPASAPVRPHSWAACTARRARGLLCLLLWHLASSAAPAPGLVTFANVPPPPRCCERGVGLLQSPKLLNHLGSSLCAFQRLWPGRVAGVALGLVIGRCACCKTRCCRRWKCCARYPRWRGFRWRS